MNEREMPEESLRYLAPMHKTGEKARKELARRTAIGNPDWDYYCAICAAWFEFPGRLDHCPNCGEEFVAEDDSGCPHCDYTGELEMTCPRCGTDGGNGGLGHACCCEREIEMQHPELIKFNSEPQE